MLCSSAKKKVSLCLSKIQIQLGSLHYIWQPSWQVAPEKVPRISKNVSEHGSHITTMGNPIRGFTFFNAVITTTFRFWWGLMGSVLKAKSITYQWFRDHPLRSLHHIPASSPSSSQCLSTDPSKVWYLKEEDMYNWRTEACWRELTSLQAWGTHQGGCLAWKLPGNTAIPSRVNSGADKETAGLVQGLIELLGIF